MLKDLLIVADGENGWEVHLYHNPGFEGAHIVLASDLTEDDADAFVERLIATEQSVTVH